jgi:hypothetical protein
MTYTADIILTPPLAVGSFISTVTPGDVAVCLCGGGSRAMTAGMGQLLALETVLGGTASLLSQTKMLSTVSGGGWVGVPFTFLRPGTTDLEFLGGPYMDPGALTVEGISSIGAECVASGITSYFTLLDMAVWAWVLHELGIPSDMLWQVLIGGTFLLPYGLYAFSEDGLPVSYFAYDQSAADAIQKANAGTSLATETPNMVAQVSGQSRPYLLCNMSMSVPDPSSPSKPDPVLVPVQSTPFFTGIFSSPGVVDINGRIVGGGGVSSFAFNSAPIAVSGSTVSVEQPRQWSLVDIIGTSSAAFAAKLISIFQDFAAHPHRFAAALRTNLDEILRKVTLLGLDGDRTATIIDDAISAVVRGDLEAHLANFSFDPTAIVPSYQYWSPSDVTGGETVQPSLFADGGSLDNTGVASALAYSDIKNVIAFINSVTALTQDANNVITVDDMIPPLFGYQPYCAKYGYVLSTQPPVHNGNAAFANNQIFPSEQFWDLLQGLWAASGSGTYLNSPIFTQLSLPTLENKWFGVVGNTAVNVLWVYLENTVSWSNELSTTGKLTSVSLIESGLVSTKKFPHYNTFLDTELKPNEIQLLANLAAWTVMSNAEAFQAMYGYSSQSQGGATRT